MELHAVYVVYVDGVLVNKAQEINFTLMSADQVVDTITGDMDGITPAPNRRKIDIQKAIAGESDEGIDFEEIKASKARVSVRLVDIVSGATSETDCYIVGDVNTTSGTGKNSQQSAEFIGAWAPFI